MRQMKTSKFNIFVALLICLSGLNSFARVNCTHDLAILHLATKTQNPAIMDFYFETSDRFINKEVKTLVTPQGQTILDQKPLVIPVDDNGNMQLRLFHDFKNTANSDSYGALLGVSVVNVRVYQNTTEDLFKFSQSSFALGREHGFNLPLVFNNFEREGKQIAVFQYLHGPNLNQIEELFKNKRLSRETLEDLRKGHLAILDQFTEFKKSDGYQKFAAEYGEMDLLPENIVNYDGVWYVLEFSKI